MQAWMTASGPSALGVAVAWRATRLPSAWITAARTWVPPRSRARTGRFIGRRFLARRGAAGRTLAKQQEAPAGTRRGLS